MNRSVHERAQELIAAADDNVSGDQQNWLRTHLEECVSCRNYAEAAGQVVRALRTQPFAADSALVEATRMRVHSRAVELRERRERIWLVCLACVLVGLSAAITTPLLWRAFEWVGAWAGVSSWIWQASFTFFGIAPALFVSALLVAHGTHLSNNEENGWK